MCSSDLELLKFAEILQITDFAILVEFREDLVVVEEFLGLVRNPTLSGEKSGGAGRSEDHSCHGQTEHSPGVSGDRFRVNGRTAPGGRDRFERLVGEFPGDRDTRKLCLNMPCILPLIYNVI